MLLSDEELERVRAEAGMVPLSRWIRAKALGERVITPLRNENPEIRHPTKEELRTINELKAEEQVRPHNIHSGSHPIKGCEACAGLRRMLVK